MSISEAWLLECDDELAIAVGDRQMVELVPASLCEPVADLPEYCAEVTRWQQLSVPVMDIRSLHHRPAPTEPGAYLCILNYQPSAASAVLQVALRVQQAPQRIRVDDAQFCEFPREYQNSLLRAVTLSCFTHHAKPVLVLDISGLCSDGFRSLAGAA